MWRTYPYGPESGQSSFSMVPFLPVHIPSNETDSDVWAATIYGTPCNIHDDDWDVALPENIDDASATCPGYSTVDIINGKSFGQVTAFSYQRYKFTLYKIAFSIINTVYTHRRTTLEQTAKRIQDIDEALKSWEAQVPPELLLRKIASARSAPDETTRLFQQQALVLQISYDNFRLLLHRPLLTMNRVSRSSDPLTTSRQGRKDAIDSAIESSRYTCWRAAVRTSQIGGFADTMRSMRYSLGASYIMIQALTAAVALGIFALSDPASHQSQDAKAGIGRIIGYPRLFDYHTAIFDQITAILEELLRLILSEEMKALVGGSTKNNAQASTALSENSSAVSSKLPAIAASATPQVASNFVSPQHTVQPSPIPSGTYDLSYGNFSDALVSLQDAFRDPRGTDVATQSAQGQGGILNDGLTGMMSNPFGMDAGWIWDDMWQTDDYQFDTG
jgi:hypothetical protein